MTSAIKAWHVEHANFLQLLDVFEEQLAEFHEAGAPDYDRMLGIVAYLREFGDTSHHQREDVAFECLVRNDPALRLPINRLLQEHRVITVAGHALADRLNEVLLGEAVVSRGTIEAEAALYLAYYRHHIATEERKILPLAARLLSDEDWSAVAAAVALVPDPLFGDPPNETYRALRELMQARAAAA
ncbi:MAG: hemerythrin domain-containing protein [Burkholderiales bacterium]